MTDDDKQVNIDADAAKKWIGNGAQPTDTVRDLLKKQGIIWGELNGITYLHG